MVDNVALQVQPLQIQPNTGFVNSLLAASQIRNANTQNQLAEYGLQERRDEQNALAQYSTRNAANDPNSLDALSAHPKLLGQMSQIRNSLDEQRRARFDFETANKGRAAAAVLQYPPEQQEQAFKVQLDNGVREGWLSPDGYKAALSKPFNPLALREIMIRGMTLDHAVAQQNREQDREAGKAFVGGLTRAYQGGGQQAGVAPPPGEVASTGGGSSVGGIPGYGAGARILSYPGMPEATPAPAATVAPPAAVAPAAIASPVAAPLPAPPAAPQINPSPSLGGVNLDKMVLLLMQGAFSPGMTKEVQETSRAMLLKAFDQYPQELRQLELFKQRPDLFDMALKLKTAGATSINTAEGEAAAQMKGRIAIDQAAIKDMAEKVSKSGSAIPLLQHVLQISKNTPAGFAGAVAPTIAKAAATLGIPVPEGMSNAELFQSITRQLVPGVRDPGAASNLEQQMYQAALPNASQSAEGREKIANMFIKMQQRDQEVVRLYRNNLGSPELSTKLEELSKKPLFTPQEAQWLELNARAAEMNKTPSAPMNKTSTGVQWIIGP